MENKVIFQVAYVNYKGEWVMDSVRSMNERRVNARAAKLAKEKALNGRVTVRKFVK